MFSKFTGGSVHENGYVTEQDGCRVQNKCDVLKSEIKTEQSEINGVSGGFLCSVCGEKFLEEDSFIKHIKSLKRQSAANVILPKFVKVCMFIKIDQIPENTRGSQGI